MNKSGDGAFLAGSMIASLLWVVIILAYFRYNEPGYAYCEEDEVYSWHMNYRPDFPDNVEWECVAVDDLIGTHNP